MPYNQRMNEKPQKRAGSNKFNASTLLSGGMLLAALALLIVNITVLRTNTSTAAQAAAAPESSVAGLDAQPALGTSGPRINVVVDFECPYCNRFLDTPAYQEALAMAERGDATLSVTAAAFLNDRSVIKGGVYNCVAEHVGAQSALALIPDLKTPGGDTAAWHAEALRLGSETLNESTLRTCLEHGQNLQRAMNAIQQAGVRGVPAVFVDGESVAWTDLGSHLDAARAP